MRCKMICILRDDITLIMWLLSPIFLGLRIFPPLVVSLWNLLLFCSQKFFGIPLVCNNNLVLNVKSLFVFLTLISFLKVLFLLLYYYYYFKFFLICWSNWVFDHCISCYYSTRPATFLIASPLVFWKKSSYFLSPKFYFADGKGNGWNSKTADCTASKQL